MGTITHSDTLYPHLLTMAGRERLVDEAYQVHDAVFSGMDRAAFRKMVLPESEHSSILLHRGEHGQAVGYCAVHLFQRRAAGAKSRFCAGRPVCSKTTAAAIAICLSWLVACCATGCAARGGPCISWAR